SGQVVGEVPGAAPEPPHVEQGAGPRIFTGTVVPAMASSNEIRTSVSRSTPAAACRPPRPRAPPVNTLNRSPRSPMPSAPNGNPSTYTRCPPRPPPPPKPPGPPGPPGP